MKYFLLAGEPSGDLHGANLIEGHESGIAGKFHQACLAIELGIECALDHTGINQS